jgi:hypothetical protein
LCFLTSLQTLNLSKAGLFAWKKNTYPLNGQIHVWKTKNWLWSCCQTSINDRVVVSALLHSQACRSNLISIARASSCWPIGQRWNNTGTFAAQLTLVAKFIKKSIKIFYLLPFELDSYSSSLSGQRKMENHDFILHYLSFSKFLYPQEELR